MVREHLATHSSTTSTLPPLTIYEMGAGNGTLMSSIIAYIERAHPTIYSTMRYNIIEISERLAERQRRAIAERHRGRVRIVNESVLEWRQRVDDECFFIALEVIVCMRWV